MMTFAIKERQRKERNEKIRLLGQRLDSLNEKMEKNQEQFEAKAGKS